MGRRPLACRHLSSAKQCWIRRRQVRDPAIPHIDHEGTRFDGRALPAALPPPGVYLNGRPPPGGDTAATAEIYTATR